MEFDDSIYRNLISHIDIDRSINSIAYLGFRDIGSEALFNEFLNDINSGNDSIEVNLIKNKAYKEAVVMSLSTDKNNSVMEMLREEQKTFGGSKVFYVNDAFDKLLVVSVPGSMEGKLNMVINRLNKINEKVSRLNLKIKKENIEAYTNRNLKDKKDFVVNMINQKLKLYDTLFLILSINSLKSFSFTFAPHPNPSPPP